MPSTDEIPRAARICILGLGNPGPKYRGTRHNIGFDWIDRAVLALGGDPKTQFSEKFQSEWLELKVGSHELHFLKPQTYMNESGKAALKWREKYQGPSEMLIVYDDVDLTVGRLRLRFSGSDGGHRGMRSVIQTLGSDEIPRLRIGVGRPVGDTVEHVLEKFKPEEKVILEKLLTDAKKHLEIWIQEASELAQNKLNGLEYL